MGLEFYRYVYVYVFTRSRWSVSWIVSTVPSRRIVSTCLILSLFERLPKDLGLLQLDTKWKGVAGIWESTRYTSSYALDILHSTRHLSMEDDVVFTDDFTPSTLLLIKEHVTHLPTDFDIYYLGCMPYIGFPLSSSVFKCKAVQTHCFIQSKKCMTILKETPFVSRYFTYMSYIDVWLSFHTKQYTIYPIKAIQ